MLFCPLVWITDVAFHTESSIPARVFSLREPFTTSRSGSLLWAATIRKRCHDCVAMGPNLFPPSQYIQLGSIAASRVRLTHSVISNSGRGQFVNLPYNARHLWRLRHVLDYHNFAKKTASAPIYIHIFMLQKKTKNIIILKNIYAGQGRRDELWIPKLFLID